MQENSRSPRRGREVLLEHETNALAKLQRMDTHPVQIHLVDGDYVVIRWTFDAVDQSGNIKRLHQLALQKWRGDRIITEQFFYDSATAWIAVDQLD